MRCSKNQRETQTHVEADRVTGSEKCLVRISSNIQEGLGRAKQSIANLVSWCQESGVIIKPAKTGSRIIASEAPSRSTTFSNSEGRIGHGFLTSLIQGQLKEPPLGDSSSGSGHNDNDVVSVKSDGSTVSWLDSRMTRSSSPEPELQPSPEPELQIDPAIVDFLDKFMAARSPPRKTPDPEESSDEEPDEIDINDI